MENGIKRPRERLFTRPVAIGCALLVAAAASGLVLLGREPVSDSGFGVWTGAWTTNTSQWLADPYSASHVLHGIFLYWLLVPLGRWLAAGTRLLVALAIESAWELIENSPAVIERYRANTASLDYFGDSVINSTCDILCALLGFWMAWRFGWKWMLAAIVCSELWMLWIARDNLTLNVLMLIWPIQAIKDWQMGL